MQIVVRTNAGRIHGRTVKRNKQQPIIFPTFREGFIDELQERKGYSSA